MNGANAFPDENTATGEYRDEFARARVQHETPYHNLWCQTVNRGDTDLVPSNLLAPITEY